MAAKPMPNGTLGGAVNRYDAASFAMGN